MITRSGGPDEPRNHSVRGRPRREAPSAVGATVIANARMGMAVSQRAVTNSPRPIPPRPSAQYVSARPSPSARGGSAVTPRATPLVLEAPVNRNARSSGASLGPGLVRVAVIATAPSGGIRARVTGRSVPRDASKP